MKKIKALTLVIILILIDQFTKMLASNYLQEQDIVIIKGVFKFYYLENAGVAFGLFQNKAILFAILSIVIMAGIAYFYSILPEEKRYFPVRLSLLFIFAGAVGNFIDRITKSYVVDFMYFELINFPVFNVADCYVTVSSILLIILFIFYYKDEDFNNLTNKKIKNNKHISNGDLDKNE